MTDASERIWVWDDEGRDCITPPGYPYPASAIEYVRADLANPLDDPRVKALQDKAKAVVDRWDSPLWKDLPHTGTHINELRAALSALEENK